MSFPIVSDFFAKRQYAHLVEDKLKVIDGMIEDQVNAFDPELAPFMGYICKTSGKRLRPILALLVGGACGGITDHHMRLGLILELVHMSSLVHDDVLDKADVRRNVATPNAKWGNSLAVLLGDALFSHAMLLSTGFDRIDLCRDLGQATKDVCEGEIMQSQRRYDYNLSQSEYFRIVEKKTAALFSAASNVAAKISGMSESVTQGMQRFGTLLGIAYQVYDDCLDIVGDEEGAGKTLHTDAETGKLTLPMLYMLEAGCRGFQHRMIDAILARRVFEFPEKDKNIAIARSVVVGQEMTSQARAQLDVLEDSPYKEALVAITSYLDKQLDKCMVACM